MTAVRASGSASRSAAYSAPAIPAGAEYLRSVRSKVSTFVSTPGTTIETRSAWSRSPNTSAARPFPDGSKASIRRSGWSIEV